jgi:type IV secretory pathway TraG/TraD family ATPase VirD4
MNNINISEQTQQRNLMNADEIQHLPANQLIIFPQGAPAIIAKKNVYYSDSRYTGKVNLPVPKNRKELLLECADSTKPDLYKKQWFWIPEEVSSQTEDIVIETFFTSRIPNNDELREIERLRRVQQE